MEHLGSDVPEVEWHSNPGYGARDIASVRPETHGGTVIYIQAGRIMRRQNPTTYMPAMDLICLKNSSTNTVLARSEDGVPLYHVETPFKLLSNSRTTITKMQGAKSVEMGIVEFHNRSDDVVTVWGKNITPHRTHGLFSSESFRASDGHEYKWKDRWGHLTLVPLSNTKTSVASFDSGSIGIVSKKRPAKLNVSPEGMPIVDEIVTSYIYARQLQERNGAAAAAGAA